MLGHHPGHVKDGRRIVGHVARSDQIHDQREQSPAVLTGNVLFALGHGLVVGGIGWQDLGTGRQRHDDSSQRKHIFPLKVGQRFASLELQRIGNTDAVDPDSDPSADGTAGRTDGANASLGGAEDVIHLQRTDGQVGPMHGLDDADQLRDDAPQQILRQWHRHATVKVAFQQRPRSRVVPMDEEHGPLRHKGLVESHDVGMIDEAGRRYARGGIGRGTAVAGVAAEAGIDGVDPHVLDAGGNLGADAPDGIQPPQAVQPPIVLGGHPKAHGGIPKGRPLLVADAGFALLVEIERIGTDVAGGDGPMPGIGRIQLPAGFRIEIAVVRPKIFGKTEAVQGAGGGERRGRGRRCRGGSRHRLPR
mmetsp:Transcript_14160/g.40619  ORF Transcript_14160/g.40619 Transcript_14160/m.40619 type:complete len:361 (-) Transcript_14160:52-1134(-)